MSIRRRRKKLTSLVSRLDERIRSVELRPINLLTSGQVEAAVVSGEDLLSPTNVVSDSAPNQFRIIQDAYYYPRKVTGGSEDRVSIYLEADLSLFEGGNLEISGIHGTSTVDIDVSGVFEVKNTDTPPWDDRASWKHDPENDQLAGVVITNEYSVRPDTAAPASWTTRYRLQTKRLVDSFSITGSTVTLTMNANHKFKVDDVIFVDIFAENSIAYDPDGLFKITAVTDNTIEYELFAGVDTPTGEVTPSNDFYVYPVARNHLPVGSTWSDSSTNTIYVWDGVRWVDYSATDFEIDDGDPPSPPTELEITDEPKSGNETTGFRTYSAVTLSWDPPIDSESGEPLTDLLGYRIGWRLSPSDDWAYEKLDEPTISSYTLGPQAALQQGETYYFKVEAYDSGNLFSEPVEATHTTDVSTGGDIGIYPPTDPDVTTRLGTVTVTWDNLLSTGSNTFAPAPADTAKMRVYLSLNNIDFNAVADATYFSSQNTFAVLTDLEYSNTYFIKITAIDTAGAEGPFSGVVSVVPKALVDTDLIEDTLNTWPFNGQVVPAGSLADGSINAASLLGPDVVTQAAISADAIGANEIAAGAVIAGKIGADAITSNNIQAGEIKAGNIDANAVTASKIFAGSITAEKIEARSISADRIVANAITANEISAQTITADKFSATLALASNMIIQDPNPNLGRIELRGNDNLGPRGIVAFTNSGGGIANSAFRFYTDGRSYLDNVEVTGTMSVSGIISGGTIRTSGGGNRVQMNGSNNQLEFYDSGNLEGILEGYGLGARLKGSGSSPASVTTSSSVATLRSGSTVSSVVCDNNQTLVRGTNGSFISSTNSSFITLNEGMTFSAGSVSGPEYIFRGSTKSFRIEDLSGNSTADVRAFSSGTLYRSTSDIRLKENIEETSLGLNFINDLKPVKFNWKIEEMGGLTNYGLIAQEVRESLVKHGAEESSSIVYEQGPSKIFDEYIEEGGDPILGFEIKELIPALIKSVKELSAKNDELEARLEALEGNN